MTAKPCIECQVDEGFVPYLPEEEEVRDNVKVASLSKEVKLLKTTLNDPHVKRIMDHVTGGDPVKLKVLESEIEERAKKMECVAKVSPILYEAGMDNIIEQVLFDKFWDRDNGKKRNLMKELEDLFKSENGYVKKAPPVGPAPKFDRVTFMKLVAKIKAESRTFFPLRNMIDFHVIHHPAFVLIGDGLNEKNEKRFGDIDTAAATADGTFVFSIKFCQALLEFAHLKGIKADKDARYGKKYLSQGGEFPDEWEYIEFLIRHELMHYTYSDFHYRKIIPEATPTLINWVGDFRTNHKLVQQGFNQLPMGLFSSYVNFHRQGSYMEMFKLVKSEFEKLKGKCKEDFEDSMEGSTDEHSEGGSTTEGGERGPERDIKPEDIDKWNKKQGKKQDEDSASAPPDYENKPPEERDPGTGKGGKHEIDYSKSDARYKWDALLKKMVGETAYVTDQSYQKISRRAIGTMQQVITRGRGAVKPGDVKNPSKKKIKLAVIVDSSGSMSYVIHAVMANLDKLLVQRQAASGVQDEFFLFMFSGSYDIYECTPGTSGIATHIENVDKKTPGSGGKMKLKDVLNHHMAGGTVFSSELAGEIKKLASRGYNCLVISDGDMLYGENFTNFKSLYESHRKHVWLLLDSKSTFTSFVQQMKEITNNASHL